MKDLEQATSGREKRNTTMFLLTAGLLLSAIFVISGQRPDYYKDYPVDFSGMSPDDYVLTAGMDDTGIPRIKQAYFENTPPPRIGVYGHHIVKYMSLGAFPFDTDVSYFFNYYVQHISLREIADLLQYQEEKGKLPTNLGLIHLSHPYLGPQLLTEYRWSMPFEFYLNSAFKWDVLSVQKVKFLGEGYISRLQFRLDWKHLAYGLFNIALGGGCQKYGMYKTGEAPHSVEVPIWMDRLREIGLGVLVDKFEAVYSQDCGVRRVQGLRGLRRYGTFYGPYEDYRWVDKGRPPRSLGMWTSEDVQSIHKIALEIQEIGKRNGLDMVFFIPPRLGSYFPNAGHEHFDQAVSLMQAGGMVVLDTRRAFGDYNSTGSEGGDSDNLRGKITEFERSGQLASDYLWGQDHVRDSYFRLIIDELETRGLLPLPSPVQLSRDLLGVVG